MELENKELCKKCGGECCKQMGCYYSAKDLKVIDSRSIKSMLDKGYTSITSDIIYTHPKITMLSLRARNTDASSIDLVSCHRGCTALTESGCMYSLEDRPSGGKYLIPRERGCCGYEEIALFDIIKTWSPHQQLLKSICEEVSGVPFDELMSLQVEEYFYYIYTHGLFDHNSLTTYRIAYPEEDNKALKRAYNINDDDNLETRIRKMF